MADVTLAGTVTTGFTTSTGATQVTVAHTVPVQPDCMLFVACGRGWQPTVHGGAGDGASSLSATYNGAAMTAVPSSRVEANGATSGYIQVFYIALGTGDNTAHNVVVTDATGLGGAVNEDALNVVAVSFYNVDQASPFNGPTTATGNSASPSVARASSVGNAILFVHGAGSAFSAYGQTSVARLNSSSGSQCGELQVERADGAASVTSTATCGSDSWASLGLDISSSSGAPPAPAGIQYVKEVGFVTNTTAGTTSAITVATGGVPAGDTIVIYGACDNTGASGAATTIAVADNSSQSGAANTYTLQTSQAIADPGAASAGQQGFFVVCVVTRPLLASDTITITYGNSTAAKAINAQQFSGVRRDVPVLASSYAVQNNQTGQSVSVATGVALSRVGQCVCALVAVEGGTADAFTQDTDSTGGAWVALTRRGSGTTTSGSTLNSVYKISTATGTQTYDHATMLGTSRDHCAAILVLDIAPTPDRRPRRRLQFPVPHARRAGR